MKDPSNEPHAHHYLRIMISCTAGTGNTLSV